MHPTTAGLSARAEKQGGARGLPIPMALGGQAGSAAKARLQQLRFKGEDLGHPAGTPIP
jgi:hypothetical protein